MINSIELSELIQTTFYIKYMGLITEATPVQKLKTYVSYTQNPLCDTKLIIGNTDFNRCWDFVPFEEYSGKSCQ